MKLTTMRETAELLGVTYSGLQAAIWHKRIPEPVMRVGAHKLFNEDEVESARRHFAKTKARRYVEVGVVQYISDEEARKFGLR